MEGVNRLLVPDLVILDEAQRIKNWPTRTDKTYFVSTTDEQRKGYAEYEYEAAKIVAILKRRPLRKEEFERLQRMLGCMRMV